MAQVQIFFGSQSGTAESFSNELQAEAEENGIVAEVVDLDAFTPESFAACKIAILVVSTYGEGEPSDNAVKFHKWASDPRHDGALKGQRFSVMGLGDMNYSRFNNMGMQTDLSLERLGGQRIYQRGVGDDSQDIYADFKQWKASGLWTALKAAINEVFQEGGFAIVGGPEVGASPVFVAPKPEVHLFFGASETNGNAKDICEDLAKQLRNEKIEVAPLQGLSDRKAIEKVRKMPKNGVAVVIVDSAKDGMCGAGRKLARNASLELDANTLADKTLTFVLLAVASSDEDFAALQSQTGPMDALGRGFLRAGMTAIKDTSVPGCVNASPESAQVPIVLGEMRAALVAEVESKVPQSTQGQTPAAGAALPSSVAPGVRILCAGQEAKEAGEALAQAWARGQSPLVEDAGIMQLTSCAQQRSQVVLAVECAADGSLGDVSRGFAAQLSAIPMAVKAQMRQLRFALVAVAATDYGNAGERASANAARAELTRAAVPVVKALTSAGASCVAEETVDMQDADGTTLATLSSSLSKALGALAPSSVVVKEGFGVAELRLAASAADLPREVVGEPSSVKSRFYFEAARSKVLKVKELRQEPCAAEGLSTVEVELEATGSLAGYSLGGTLALLPQNDATDVAAMLPFFGLAEASLTSMMTFGIREGTGNKVKRPFPTPCTLGDALSLYCDLGRAPTKEMLTAMQSCFSDQDAKDKLGKVLSDSATMELLRAGQMCCRMHEFWALVGITKIPLCEFLIHCPRQRAREFTIASSPKASPERICLCVSLTSHERTGLAPLWDRLQALGIQSSSDDKLGQARFFGMCSRWVTTGLKSGTAVLAKQRSSAFHLPSKDVPVMMVGAGAGVAPFRGFWEELRRGSQTAPAALFFGCRHPDKDWLFKQDMNSNVKLAVSGCAALQRVQAAKKPLTCLFTAFSRPGADKKGQYVQDQVRAQSRSVKHWIEKMSGCVYICGSTAMGRAVLDVLGEILEGGAESVDDLRKDGRIVAEMWG